MRRGTIICGAVLCVLMAPSARAQEFEPGQMGPCFEYAPASVSANTSPPIDVHVHVVLDDGVPLDTGRRVIERAQLAYAPLGLNLRPSFTTARTASDEYRDLFTELKALFGGERPPWAHVVYLLTNRDIHDGTDPGVAGVADCIGGVAFSEFAFAVGEAEESEPFELGDVSWWTDSPARIGAHEIAHLFGAHHHYAECSSALARDESPSEPCTLMFPELAFMTTVFSPLNGAIVRGHAESYLEPVTGAAPPDGSPTVPPPLRPCELVPYRDVRGDHSEVGRDPVDVDLVRGMFLTAGDGVVRFRWTLADLTGAYAGATGSPVRYTLEKVGPKELTVEVAWDGKSAPVARALAGSSVVAELRATVVTGTDGVVEVELPRSALGLAGPFGVGRIAVLSGEEVDWDRADPILRTVDPARCGQPPQAPPAQLPAGKPAARTLARVELLDRSAARRRLRVRVHGTLRRVRVRLLDDRGRAVATGRAARVSGSRIIGLRARRSLRAGGHRLVLSARDRAGRSVKQSLPVMLRR